MDTAEEKISKAWGKPVYEIRENQIIFSDSEVVKIAILSDRDRYNLRALMFSQNTVLYLLNNSGKVIETA